MMSGIGDRGAFGKPHDLSQWTREDVEEVKRLCTQSGVLMQFRPAPSKEDQIMEAIRNIGR